MNRNKLGQFQKGIIPWNKNKFGYMGANKTSLTKDTVRRSDYITPQKATRDCPMIVLEHEFISVRSKNGKIYQHHKRIPYSKYVLLQNGIEVPKGCVVFHKDGDNKNNIISNLEVITRAELAKRNKNANTNIKTILN